MNEHNFHLQLTRLERIRHMVHEYESATQERKQEIIKELKRINGLSWLKKGQHDEN